MSSFVGLVSIGVIIVAILFGSAMLAMAAAGFLPPDHLSAETKGVGSVSVAVVGTMSALVVGLLISNSSASFTSKTQELTQISTEVISLDRMLRRYGPETQDMRAMLRGYAEATMQDLFPNGPSQGPDLENGTTPARLEQLQGKILALRPASPVQHWLQVTAQGFTVDLLNPLRVRRFAEAKGRLAKTDRADALTIAQFIAVMAEAPRPGRRADLDPLLEHLTVRRRLCAPIATTSSNTCAILGCAARSPCCGPASPASGGAGRQTRSLGGRPR